LRPWNHGKIESGGMISRQWNISQKTDPDIDKRKAKALIDRI
jgi:hypothetical protein